ncbi:MAG: chemotaxis protein CheA, partial [Bdellovibrionota bacterium]
KAFYVESGEILDRLETDLQRMEFTPGDPEVINSIFRGLHTIKGNSSFLSLQSVTGLAHAAETLLDKARKKEVTVTSTMVQVVRAAFDDLKRLIVDQENVNVAPTVANIHAFMEGRKPVFAVAPAAATAPVALQKVATGNFVRVDEVKISKIISLVSELELLRYSLELVPDKMEVLGRAGADLRFEVDLQVSKLSRLTRSLSGLVFGVRLVPVNQVFMRFPKVVKELALRLDKEIRLEIAHGDAELDKSIVEAIADPMTHLIRNSADHGIESPDDRVKAGKPREGKIRLNSFVRGNFVFIEISDDGRGIDGNNILKKAVEKGIVPKDKAAGFTETQKLGLIFAPGFSTAEKVTELSGRGVGMDVVKSNINRLKGTVIIDSQVGHGTVIQLRFPMSVVVLFSLFVEVNKTCCALPVEQVNESIDFNPAELLGSFPEGGDPSQYIALYSLRSLLWGQTEEVGGRKSYHALRFKDSKGQNMAFIVDEYSSIEEAIVQSVDSYIATLPGIQGATIRKDGSVGLVLNPDSIVEHALKARPFAYVKVKVAEEKEEVTLTDFLGFAQAG